MTPHEARLQSLSLTAAFLIAFLGLAHEFIGPTLFPWAPVWFGPVAWHALGVVTTLIGLCSMAAVWGVLRFPVVTCGWLVGVVGFAAVALMATMHGQFHYLATWLGLAGFTLAVSHRRALRARSRG